MKNEIDILKKLKYFNSPSYLVYHVTFRCDSMCSYCFNWKTRNCKDKNELSINDIEKLAKGFPNLMQLTLSGGEPTLRDDLPEICAIFSKTSKVNLITLPTNGLNTNRIITAVNTIIKNVPDIHLRMVLTLNGLESLHNRITGVTGAFKGVIETYRELESIRKKNKNMTVDIITVLSNENQGSIPELAEFIKKYLDVNTHLITLVRGDLKNPGIKNVDPKIYYNLANTYSKTHKRNKNKPFSKLIDVISKINIKTIYKTISSSSCQLPCLAGKKLLLVTADGILKPCEYIDKTFGDLKEMDFDVNKLLNSTEYKNLCDYIRSSGCFCSWECSTQANIIYNPYIWPKIFWKYLLGKRI